jgi:hypothetical protein
MHFTPPCGLTMSRSGWLTRENVRYGSAVIRSSGCTGGGGGGGVLCQTGGLGGGPSLHASVPRQTRGGLWLRRARGTHGRIARVGAAYARPRSGGGLQLLGGGGAVFDAAEDARAFDVEFEGELEGVSDVGDGVDADELVHDRVRAVVHSAVGGTGEGLIDRFVECVEELLIRDARDCAQVKHPSPRRLYARRLTVWELHAPDKLEPHGSEDGG